MDQRQITAGSGSLWIVSLLPGVDKLASHKYGDLHCKQINLQSISKMNTSMFSN